MVLVWKLFSNSPSKGKQNRQTPKLVQYMVNKNQFIVFVADQEFSCMENNVFHLCQR